MDIKEASNEVEHVDCKPVKELHLLHSHAHEGIPGTVYVQATEGDDTALGQALFPVPSLDPNDPLQWSSFKKNMILAVCAAYSFLGNAALYGISPYIAIYAEEFKVDPTTASGIVTWPNLVYGFSSWILVPLYLKFGRRPVMLGSLIVFTAGMAGCSGAKSFAGLYAARVIHAFGSGVCEALPVQLVNDIFFLHERGKKIGYYTVALCLGAAAPMVAAYMLNGGLSWRLYFYVIIAFTGVVFILAFFFVEETLYSRVSPANESGQDEDAHDAPNDHIIPRRKTFVETLKIFCKPDPDVSFLMTMIRPFTYFLVPVVLWVITTYGLVIGIGGMAFNYTFPIKITQPPYNWSQLNSGLITVGSIIAFVLAAPLTFVSDRCAAWLTRRNNGIREAEMRLWPLLAVMLIGPAGLVLFGLSGQYDLHWIGYFFGIGMNTFSTYFYMTFTLAYAVDSYFGNTSEMLIAMNFGKQAISTGIASYVLSWILKDGYAVVISGIFGSVALVNNLMVFVFLIWGKRIRIAMTRSWLGRLHSSTQEATQ